MKTMLNFAGIYLVDVKLCSHVLGQIVDVVYILVCSTLTLISNYSSLVFALKFVCMKCHLN